MLMVLAYAIALCGLLMLMGCSAKKEVIESVRIERDTVYDHINTVIADTTKELRWRDRFIRDSISPNLDSVGRVIGYNYYHYESNDTRLERLEKGLKEQMDSLLEKSTQESADNHTLKEYVERPRSIWEMVRLALFWPLLIVAVGAVAGVIYVRKKKT